MLFSVLARRGGSGRPILSLESRSGKKATKILQSCQVSPSKTFGGPSERQRAELAGRLHRS
jgi:hypothetical protein